MSKLILVGAFLCAALAAACGGDSGSGVSSSKSLVSLNDSEIKDLCEYVVEVSGPERMVDCGGGLTLTTGGNTVAECTTGLKAAAAMTPSCAATVGDAESCIEDFADLSDSQLCMLSIPPSCMKLAQCDIEM